MQCVYCCFPHIYAIKSQNSITNIFLPIIAYKKIRNSFQKSPKMKILFMKKEIWCKWSQLKIFDCKEYQPYTTLNTNLWGIPHWDHNILVLPLYIYTYNLLSDILVYVFMICKYRHREKSLAFCLYTSRNIPTCEY